MKVIVLTVLFLGLFGAQGMSAEVQNVRPPQAGNRILFEFDVVGGGGGDGGHGDGPRGG